MTIFLFYYIIDEGGSKELFLVFYIPYVPVKGSLNIPSLGVQNVKMMKDKAMVQSIQIGTRAELQRTFSSFSALVSYTYTAAALMKKMAIFTQSGEFPITPL